MFADASSCQAATTRKRAIGPAQRYQLLLQPVPMGTIGTGCNSSWYLWPSTDLVEGNWHRVVVPTGLNHHPVPNEGGAKGTGL